MYPSQGTQYGISYVIAKNPHDAYQKVRKELDKNDIGLSHDRELSAIELLAENSFNPDCKTILYAY
jgi:hypothetical protein